jgi:hypothetical protein
MAKRSSTTVWYEYGYAQTLVHQYIEALNDKVDH